MIKTPEELAEYNLGYKEGRLIGTNYVQMIRAANYANDVSLAKEIAANVMERLENKTVSHSFVSGFWDAICSIRNLFEEATKALKEKQNE